MGRELVISGGIGLDARIETQRRSCDLIFGIRVDPRLTLTVMQI